MRIRELVSMDILKGLSKDMSETEVKHLTSDSRKASPGSVFVAIRGEKIDGHAFLQRVMDDGAVLALGEMDFSHPRYIKVKSSREAFARLAAAYYRHPSRELLMIGVTGTCGKTTTTHLIESIVAEAGHQTGLIGTNGIRYLGKSIEATHTTPDPLELHKLLCEMRTAGCTAAVMEVSSHALSQHRVTGIDWDVVAFTNLSTEHLDYHKSMEEYFAAKKLLFTDHILASRKSGKEPKAVINTGDPYGERLFNAISRIDGAQREFSVKSAGLTIDARGIRGRIKEKDQDLEIESSLLGEFNAENILTAANVALALGLPSDAITRGIRKVKAVRGRMELVPLAIGNAPQVIVDYAHKPEALAKVLGELRKILSPKGRLLTVFGCGGDRDRTKRPMMGKLAEDLSDEVVVTSDNPRTEKPEAIIAEIVRGMKKSNHEIRPDRREAIHLALEDAGENDIVLIAGKGHETGQIVGETKHPFDDVQVALEFSRSRPKRP